MSETTLATVDSEAALGTGRWRAEARAADAKLWRAVLAALLLHAMLLVSVSTSTPERLGDASGADDGISVDLVTQADLDSLSSVASQAPAGSPTPPPAAMQPPAEPTPPAEATPPVTPKPPVEPTPQTAEATPPAPAEKAVEPPPAEKPVEKPAEPPPLAELDALDPLDPKLSPAEETKDPKAEAAKTETPKADPAKAEAPKPEEKKPEPKKPETKKPEPKKTARLDLSPPAPKFTDPFAGSGGSAGFERPAGITRSGANDDFARRVIRALQQTMPQLSNTFGRVTVRIVLNDTGNVTNVTVERPSNIAGLDQNVVFAARQTSYPIPPPGSKDVDRLFLVTYIYR